MLKKLTDLLFGPSDAQKWREKAMHNDRLYLRLLRETRSLNKTVQRQSRTIKRLRAQIALDAPTYLPPLAQTPEGRALYNHAYQQGRRKGRKDQLIGNSEPVEPGDGTNALEHTDAIGTPAEPPPGVANDDLPPPQQERQRPQLSVVKVTGNEA